MFYLFNCVIEFCLRAWNQQRSCSPGRVYSLGKRRGHKSIFFLSFFWLQKTALPCRGIPPAAGSLLPRSSLHVLRFAFWWWNFSPFFTPCSRWGFPLICIEHGFDVKLLCFLIWKKPPTIYCVVFLIQEAMHAVEYLALKWKRIARPCAKKIEDHMQKCGLMIKPRIEALYVPWKWKCSMVSGWLFLCILPSLQHLIHWAHNSTAGRGVNNNKKRLKTL